MSSAMEREREAEGRKYEERKELPLRKMVEAQYLGVSTPSRSSQNAQQSVTTPPMKESRRLESLQRYITEDSEKLRSLHRGSRAPGPKTFEKQYIPFAGGFNHMADEAAVYRSTRLHAINPTAAVSDDISYYYTLDSGRVPPAAMAANPETAEEFVRNTTTQTHGGMWNRLMKPIE